jgi:hypothetical protein
MLVSETSADLDTAIAVRLEQAKAEFGVNTAMRFVVAFRESGSHPIADELLDRFRTLSRATANDLGTDALARGLEVAHHREKPDDEAGTDEELLADVERAIACPTVWGNFGELLARHPDDFPAGAAQRFVVVSRDAIELPGREELFADVLSRF